MKTRHPCGHTNGSLICPCTATLPAATIAQRQAGLLVEISDLTRVGAAARPAPTLPPRGDDR